MNNNERRIKATGTWSLGKIIIIIIIIRFRQSRNVTVYIRSVILYIHIITTDWETAACGMDKQPGQQGRCHLHRDPRKPIWGRGYCRITASCKLRDIYIYKYTYIIRTCIIIHGANYVRVGICACYHIMCIIMSSSYNDFRGAQKYCVYVYNNIYKPWQWNPSPTYPGKQEHAKLPSVLVQWANTSHGRYLHSFSSVNKLIILHTLVILRTSDNIRVVSVDRLPFHGRRSARTYFHKHLLSHQVDRLRVSVKMYTSSHRIVLNYTHRL